MHVLRWDGGITVPHLAGVQGPCRPPHKSAKPTWNMDARRHEKNTSKLSKNHGILRPFWMTSHNPGILLRAKTLNTISSWRKHISMLWSARSLPMAWHYLVPDNLWAWWTESKLCDIGACHFWRSDPLQYLKTGLTNHHQIFVTHFQDVPAVVDLI